MKQYSYDGPVMEFDRCIANRWKASTYAVSEKKREAILLINTRKEIINFLTL